ncbi:esterase/lipase family protein [Solimonas terrae]|uniref:Alpha/beta hydrolase n=1 Tax=Solimonas terrae TaxID=1396819 RepID=A0A6M2BS54_9GAMM|nr:alpha/beta fold hydrolase [Solimonas terrae]NGY05160.1 alpha/beta hydrolase [Solimonas terrae]
MPIEKLPAPAASLLLLEGRIGLEMARFALAIRGLRHELPRGHAQPLIVIPGFGATDTATAALRHLLSGLGYASHGWGLGRNLGMRRGVRDALNTQLQTLHADKGGVTLVGWSLGGVFAREIARHRPQYVRRVITLGSPINRDPDANNMLPLVRLANGGKAPKTDLDAFARRITAPPVPCTAIYTKTDGIVAWRACLEDPAPNVENIEVSGSHFGLPFNPQVARIIAERLSRPD